MKDEKVISKEKNQAILEHYDVLSRVWTGSMPKKLISVIRTAHSDEEAELAYMRFSSINYSSRFIFYTTEQQISAIMKLRKAMEFFEIEQPAFPDILRLIEF